MNNNGHFRGMPDHFSLFPPHTLSLSLTEVPLIVFSPETISKKSYKSIKYLLNSSIESQ